MGGLWDGLQSLIGSTLAFFYGLVPNFGVAISLLTVLIGVILFPLTLKQTRSMKAMQEIQPEVKKLQRELKHDKQAQQQALMALYRERGVNPAAGCLPLVLQMPVWFALFSVLRSFAEGIADNAVRFIPEGGELEGAVRSAVAGEGTLDFLWMDLRISPSNVVSGYTAIVDGRETEIAGNFIGFIPYLITIGIVMFTAYWQQKQIMAKQQSQNQQQVPGQAIMKIFPFLFGFISFSLPAGLVVYFAASQIFRIGQQALILGMDDKKSAPEPKGKPKATHQTPPPSTPSSNGDTTPPAAGGKPKPRPQGSKKRGKKRRRR
ncbi:MAG: YidC/Oxa1 family membrane protein insertase [Acidimicrobiia bacterium]